MAKENQKDIIYYEALLKLWIDNRMILTKTFITISAGGIGILIAFSNNYKLETNFQAATFLFAIFFFILTIGCCIGMYHYNPPHLEKVLENINKKEEIKESKALKWLYRITIISLVLALRCAGPMTCFSVYNNLKKYEVKKCVKKKTTTVCHCPLMEFSKCDQQPCRKPQTTSMVSKNCNQREVQKSTKTLKKRNNIIKTNVVKKTNNQQ